MCLLFKLPHLHLKASIKGTILDIVLYMNPSISLCIFIAWMHCVYSNSMAYVPVYVVAGILAFLVRNYYKYGVNEEFNFGFAPITITEMIRVLLYGGPNTKYIKPIKVARKNVSPKSTNGNKDELDVSDDDIIDHSLFDNASGFDFGADHMDFPFSEGDRYSKKTLKEACVDASALFQEDDDDNERSASSGAFSSLRRKAKVNTIHLPKANREDDDEDDEDEFALMVKTSVRQPNGSSHEATKPQTIVQNNGLDGGEKNRRPNSDALTSATPDKVWKRVKDTRGLPEQDASVFVKSRKTLKEELIHNKNLLHKMSKRMFDDRLFIINEGDPGPPADEVALHQAIGTNKYKNPMVSMIAEYVAPALEMLKVGLSAWRSVFNLFTWRDPFLTSLFFFGVSLLLCVLLVFPWRLFFFVVGFGAVGPQVSSMLLIRYVDAQSSLFNYTLYLVKIHHQRIGFSGFLESCQRRRNRRRIQPKNPRRNQRRTKERLKIPVDNLTIFNSIITSRRMPVLTKDERNPISQHILFTGQLYHIPPCYLGGSTIGRPIHRCPKWIFILIKKSIGAVSTSSCLLCYCRSRWKWEEKIMIIYSEPVYTECVDALKCIRIFLSLSALHVACHGP